jgi:hypothetical protein
LRDSEEECHCRTCVAGHRQATAGCVAGELTLDQIPYSDDLFGGDIFAEYHQIRTAFGEATAQAALTDKAVTYDASLDTPSARRLGASGGATLWRGGRGQLRR